MPEERPTPNGSNLTEVGAELAEHRETLQRLEVTALASTVPVLTDAVERLLEIQRELREMLPDDWMTHEEAAIYLRTTPDALYRLVREGEIPREKVGKKNLYSRRDVDAAVRRGR